MKPPITIRTADVLAACPYNGEFAMVDFAKTMALPSSRLSGHFDWLCKAGKLVRLRRGWYALTDHGRAMRGPDFGGAA